MSTIINGTSDAITFPDATIQNTSAIVGGKVPYTNLPAGSVLQVVQGTYATEVGITSGSATDTGLSVSITPKFSTSKILVLVTQEYLQSAPSGTTLFSTMYVVRNSTVLINGNRSISMGVVGASGITQTIAGSTYTMCYLDSPATTSATTYKTQANVQTVGTGNAIYLQNNASPSYITVMEIAA